MNKVIWIPGVIVLLLAGTGLYYVGKNSAPAPVTLTPPPAIATPSVPVALVGTATTSAPTEPPHFPTQVPPTIVSSANLFGPDAYVPVTLVSSDQKTSVESDPGYCGAPGGAEVSGGHYTLAANSGSTLDLGELSFTKGTPWDGKLAVEVLDPNGYPDFMTLEQYGSCNGEMLSVYGYDWNTKKLLQYNFISKDGRSSTDVFTRGYKKSMSGNLVTSAYDNAVGQYTTQEWAFDKNRQAFVETALEVPKLDAAGQKIFTSPTGAYSFSYPAEFALSTELTADQVQGSYSISCDTTANADPSRRAEACLWYVGKEYPAGFEAADFEVRVTPTAADCKTTTEGGSGVAATQTKVIDGVTYYYDQYSDASVGHRLGSKQYRTYYYGNCYSITMNLGSHVYDAENDTWKELSTEFYNTMFAKLDAIFATFHINQTQ